jgi:hypothetical protein
MNPILFRAHAVQRMFERKISLSKVRAALQGADVIEDYSSEMPEPSRLLMGMQGLRPFHIVVAENDTQTTVITVYLPAPDKWRQGARSRR